MYVLFDLLKILLPAALGMYGIFLTVRSFLNKDLEKKILELRQGNTATVLPLRLQAAERLVLFLERIRPNNLVMRLNNNALSVAEYHQVLLHEIREELNHNLVQQVYVSNQAWNLTRKAQEDVIGAVNLAAQSVSPDAVAYELSRALLELIVSRNQDPVEQAITFVKDEIRSTF